MGVSTDAILCYGFEVAGEDETPAWMNPLPDQDKFDFDDMVISLMASHIKAPAVAYGDDSADEWRAYWDVKREFMKSVRVELITHCSYESPMYILAVKASVKLARRGYPVTLTDNDLTVNPEWKDILLNFCSLAGIYVQDPSWILCSMWS